MKPRSVRFRITAAAVVITAVVLLVSAALVVLMTRSQLWNNIDSSLTQRADEIEAALIHDATRELPASSREERFAQVLNPNGQVLLSTPNIAGLDAVVDPPSDGSAVSMISGLPIDEDEFRVLVRRLDDGRYLVVGESADDIGEALRSLIVALVLTIPIAVAVLGGMVWWLVGRTLRPVERIRREVDAIGLAELDRRVSAPRTGDEIDELANTMNSMLARLERSADRQRRFVSDVSHDLRTPLARMRSTLEVELTQPADRLTPESLARASQSALDEVMGMEDLVEDLLLVARLDSDRAAREPRLVDLDVIVDEEVRKLRPVTSVRVDMTGVSGATVLGDASQLARVVRNLLSNAIRHARLLVAIRLVDHDEVELTVDDDGPGIPPAERERVFERFVRLDEARARSDGGSGLGLAIAHDVVSAHGGHISIADAPIGGTRVSVVLPAVGSRPPRDTDDS